ncbi:MAG: cheY [Segetibacter sp.]|nr:cheY [Segetibacter sp.]
MKHICNIVLVDNDQDEAALLNEVIGEKFLPVSLQHFSTREEADRGLEKGILPDLILLDVEPGNHEWVRWISKLKKSDRLKSVPVIVYSTVYDWEIKELVSSTGALQMIRKPVDSVGFENMLNEFCEICNPDRIQERELAKYKHTSTATLR